MHRIFLGLLILIALAGAPASAAAIDLPAGFSTMTLAEGLDYPTAIAYASDGRLFIAEKAGRLRVVSAEGHLRAAPVLDFSDRVASYGDQGLLGLALDTDFETNGLVYLLYNFEAHPEEPLASKTARLTRIRVLPDDSVEIPAAPETVLLGSVEDGPCPAPADTVDCFPSDSGTHTIGTVRSDSDGTLWVGSGDGADFNGVDIRAPRTYDEASLAGKILHVDREGRGLPGHAFCPAQTNLDFVCTKIHAKGFRNPFRFQLRPDGAPLVGDVGWNTFEELNVAQKGRSYGWPCFEGAMRTPGYRDLDDCQTQYGLTHFEPAYAYAHDWEGGAVHVGPVYSATHYPAQYRGSWFFGDYVTGFLKQLDIDDQDQIGNVRPFATGFHGVDLELAPNGDLAYADLLNSSVQQVVYGNRPPEARASATPASGEAPLATTLSAAGSSDPDGDDLVSYEWDFQADGTIDATGETVSFEYPAGFHHARLTVRDEHGLRDDALVSITADEQSAPTATIESPPNGYRFRHGTPVTLQGSGEDPQDGALSDDALSWRIVLHHGSHVHPLADGVRGHEISFTPPGDHDADSHYEITLTATDTAGQTDKRTVNIRPETVELTLASSPPGATLAYSGLNYATPAQLTVAIGYRTTVSAPAELQRDGVTYRFDSWSDGGARLHDIVVPDRDTTLTVVYRAPAPILVVPPALGGLSDVRGESAIFGPRVSLRRPSRSGARSLGGRLLRSEGRLRVEVALRTSGRRCRTWSASRGAFGRTHTGCGRPRWMRTSLTKLGFGDWLWRKNLRGPLRRGSYVVSTRAVDSRGKVVAGMRSTIVHIR
jgi:glucose/arabinose dehydrogenase